MLAEISDKMPTVAGTFVASLAIALICGWMAWTIRPAGWAALSVSFVVGSFFARAGHGFPVVIDTNRR
jgi:hypothetical protein